MSTKRSCRKYVCLVSLWLVLHLGIGCNAVPEGNPVTPTPAAYSPQDYCTSIAGGVSPPDPQEARSPVGKRYAIVDRGCSIVVDTAQERAWSYPAAADSFWRWTADGRFAIFRYRNAKGNAITSVFDTAEWRFEQTPGCPLVQSGSLMAWGFCGDYPIALAPNAPRFLMENGSLIDLPRLQGNRLQAHWDTDHQIVLAAEWSPRGNYLAFVTGRYPFGDGTLYLASGDGTRVRQSVSFEGTHALGWAADGTSVIVETETRRYSVEAATMRVQVTSIGLDGVKP